MVLGPTVDGWGYGVAKSDDFGRRSNVSMRF